MSKLPKIDLEELKEDKKRNFEEKLKFIDQYVAWLKKQPDKVWSTQHKKFLDG